jgi:hypothetical protein
MWWEHLQEPCNGSKDSELLLKAKEEAGKHFVAIAEKEARKAAAQSASKKQSSIIKLNQKQLQAEAEEAIARWAFATGQPLSAVDDYFFREAMEKVAAAGSSRDRYIG